MKFQISRASHGNEPIDLPGVEWEKISYIIRDAYINDYDNPDIEKYLAQFKIVAIRETKEPDGTTSYCFDYVYTEIIEVITINYIEELLALIEEGAWGIVVYSAKYYNPYPTLVIYDDYIE